MTCNTPEPFDLAALERIGREFPPRPASAPIDVVAALDKLNEEFASLLRRPLMPIMVGDREADAAFDRAPAGNA